MRYTLVIGMVFLMTGIAEAEPNTWNADPCTFYEIQLQAQSGDTILMASGTYHCVRYQPGYPGFFAIIYPQGKNIIYKKDPNSSGEAILSGYCRIDDNFTQFWPPCEIKDGEGNGCQVIGLTIRCSPLPYELITDFCTPWIGIVCNGSSPLIKDCNLVGYDYAFENGTGRAIYKGIYTTNTNGKLVVQSCHITDFNGLGIGLSGDVNVQINNCVLSGIHTEFSGIGITTYPTRGTVQINNCTISNFGRGGIFVPGIEGGVVALDLEVNSCHIVGNTIPGGSGGGIAWSSTNNNTMLVSRCNLIGNTAFDSGGGIYSTGSMARIEDCNIIGNIASYTGGGIYCGNSHSTIKNCKVENNTAGDAGGGIDGSTCIDVNHCIIRGNTATWGAGGIKVYDANIINCVINENRTGGYGGGLLIDHDVCLKNCTIRNNEANELGGGAFFGSGPINVTNCIFWENADTEGYPRYHQIYSWNPNYINLRNCDIQNTSAVGNYVFDDNIVYPDTNTIGKTLGGNIDANPLFVDDYHLGGNSPCINAGYNNAVYWAYDIDGEDRILDATVDIGADEKYYCLNPADYNKDGIVNFLDFAIFADTWQTQNPNISLDTDTDNDVDINDLKIFCENWLSYCH